MAYRSNDVIHQVTRAEPTVAALVSEHPKSGENAALAHPIRGITAASNEYAGQEFDKRRVASAAGARRGNTEEQRRPDEETFAQES